MLPWIIACIVVITIVKFMFDGARKSDPYTHFELQSGGWSECGIRIWPWTKTWHMGDIGYKLCKTCEHDAIVRYSGMMKSMRQQSWDRNTRRPAGM